ncbi:MAG: aldo/keto reductase [Panacagrimonas sp.]
METRVIPSSGERIPVIGIGTYRAFDVTEKSAPFGELGPVLDELFDAGGSVIDSSPMYGKAERTTGALLAGRKTKSRPFLATKVWTSGRAAGVAQMEDSFRRLRTHRIDLMQIHNLVDWKTHLPVLREMKERGHIRYVGITHYSQSAHAAVEDVLRSETIDFVQINYALDDRAVEASLLPLAQDRGVAVICNMPFGGGGLLGRLKSKPLPAWASEVGAHSWAPLALKFLLANPAVTCLIPGTGKSQSMQDNAAAGFGGQLSPAQRRELIATAS